MDGFEAISRIRKSANGMETIIIALTASAFEEDRVKVLEHGGNDFVRKPFREHEIFEILKKYLGVKFKYEDKKEARRLPERSTISRELLQSEVAALPEKMLSRLVEATELSDASMIDQVIREIDNEHAELAGALTNMADSFAYDEMLSLIKY